MIPPPSISLLAASLGLEQRNDDLCEGQRLFGQLLLEGFEALAGVREQI
jgi:hypothetical protein